MILAQLQYTCIVGVHNIVQPAMHNCLYVSTELSWVRFSTVGPDSLNTFQDLLHSLTISIDLFFNAFPSSNKIIFIRTTILFRTYSVHETSKHNTFQRIILGSDSPKIYSNLQLFPQTYSSTLFRPRPKLFTYGPILYSEVRNRILQKSFLGIYSPKSILDSLNIFKVQIGFSTYFQILFLNARFPFTKTIYIHCLHFSYDVWKAFDQG